MKLKLLDNDQWIRAEKKKRKRRMLSIMGCVLVFFVTLLLGILYNAYQENTGRFYPDFNLSELPSGALPVVEVPQGETHSIIKCPSLPYTLIIPGSLVTEEESYCIFLMDDLYVMVGEIPENQKIADYLSEALYSFGEEVISCKTFNQQKGYLNERYVLTEGNTVAWKNNQKGYVLSCRVVLGSERDLLLSSVSPTMELSMARKVLESIFYTLHEMQLTEEREVNPGTRTVGFTGNDSQDNNIPMDEDGFPETGNEKIIETNPNGIHQKKTGILYRSDEEVIVDVSSEYELAYFVFAYGMYDVTLQSIVLYDPEGKMIYHPDEVITNHQKEYVFHIESPMTGEWRFLFSAEDEIGYYHAFVTTKEQYLDSMEQTQIRVVPEDENVMRE